MTTLHTVYQGQLTTQTTHPSGSVVQTTAPVDNGGTGELFSPTDLLATALATCCITIMAKKAESMDITLAVRAETVKTMAANPRRVAEVRINFHFEHAYDDKTRTLLEAAARSCPVAQSLAAEVRKELVFHYPQV